MQRYSIATASGSCQYWRGGRGSPLLLIHGGWAGAEAHWETIWDELTTRHDVIAVELPGISRNPGAALPDYGAHAQYCADLLIALNVTSAVVVGNSLGASIGWQLTADRPDRVTHLIMIDGFPPRPLPLRTLLGLWPLSALALKSLTAGFYGPSVFKSGFEDPAKVPGAIRANLSAPSPAMAEVMFRLLRSVTEKPGLPQRPVDFVWGEADHLANVTLADGLKLSAMTPGSRIITIPSAGHLPQIENPAAVLAAIVSLTSAEANA